MVGEETGIVLSDGKRQLVYSRLARRIRALGLNNFGQYIGILKSGNEEELVQCVDAITTNLTSFFREAHHFEYLHDSLLPDLMRRNASTRRIRIWSAGCSTGPEPYSIAMVAREVIPQSSGWDVRILATDLDTKVLATAAEGVYSEEKIEGISEARRRRWLRGSPGPSPGTTRMPGVLREMISFGQLNLMNDWPMRGPLDAVFCRNVIIYFSKDTQRMLFDRFAKIIHPEGLLFLGHSESAFNVTTEFSLIGKTIYRHTAKGTR